MFYTTQKIQKFLSSSKAKTPFLVVDLEVVASNFSRLAKAFAEAQIFYAVKANPATQIIKCLDSRGCNFDAASIFEIRKCIRAGVSPTKISYGNTIKKQSDISEAYKLGVRLFAFDCYEDLEKLSRNAKGSKVLCRIGVGNKGAKWPLSQKFGCSKKLAVELMVRAKKMGLDPFGISFHVGSQQIDITAWEKAIKKVGAIESDLLNYQISMRAINIGGGFPVAYHVSVPGIEDIASLIRAYVSKHLSKNFQTILVEPGRYIAASAGVLRSQVIMVSKKSHYSKKRWVYLDVGTFGGLIETLNEVIQYPLRTAKDNEEGGPVVIAGPTCDGADVMYSNTRCILPLSLTSSDHVDILGAGAYTTSYASKCFNGFKGPSEFYL